MNIFNNKMNLKWYQPLIFFILINLVAGLGVTFFADIKVIYAELAKPYFAPATFLFGIVWPINNILTLIGNVWALQKSPSSNRTNYLKLQIASWINYAVFQYLSFGLFSVYGKAAVSMFFWPTFSMLLLTFGSIYYAYKMDTEKHTFLAKVKSGKSITMSLTSLVSWLLIATALGFNIWMMNK